jgi:hypothetical protein
MQELRYPEERPLGRVSKDGNTMNIYPSRLAEDGELLRMTAKP